MYIYAYIHTCYNILYTDDLLCIYMEYNLCMTAARGQTETGLRVYTYTNIYIYIYRERERDIEREMHIYIYIYAGMCVYVYIYIYIYTRICTLSYTYTYTITTITATNNMITITLITIIAEDRPRPGRGVAFLAWPIGYYIIMPFGQRPESRRRPRRPVLNWLGQAGIVHIGFGQRVLTVVCEIREKL